MIRKLSLVVSVIGFTFFTACTTQQDLRRDQEIDRLKNELREVKGNKVDADVVGEDIQDKLTRLTNQQEEQTHLLRTQLEEMKKEFGVLQAKIQSLENQARLASQAGEARNTSDNSEKASRPTYEAAKKLYDDGKYGEAAETLRLLLRSKTSADEAKKAHFLLGEAYFADKEFASAALEFSEFKKNYAKDALVPSAIYRQANSFRAMGKTKEAKLFYQELIERFPKNMWTGKARSEMRKLSSAGSKSGKRTPNQIDEEEQE